MKTTLSMVLAALAFTLASPGNAQPSAGVAPAPVVRFRNFGDSALDFRLYVWVDYDEGLAQTSAILSAVYDALAEAGVSIPFPQRDLHLRSVSDDVGRALRGEKD